MSIAVKRKMIALRDAYADTLIRLGRVRKDIVVLDADLASSTRTGKFGEVYPDRFFNMGISEQNMVGTAAGFAAAGKTPFISTFAIFFCRGLEPFRQVVCYPNLPVKAVVSHGGITVGEDGVSQQSVEDIGVVRSLPNLTIIVPGDAVEMGKAVEAALDIPGPVYIRGSREKFPVLYDEGHEFRVGRGDVLSEGQDLTLIACGIMVSLALEAREALLEEGIQARVVNLATIKPVDTDLVVRCARETGAIVTAEEHNIIGGLGSAVAEVLGEHAPVPLKRVGVMDCFARSGKAHELMQAYGLTAEKIAAAARDVLERKRSRE